MEDMKDRLLGLVRFATILTLAVCLLLVERPLVKALETEGMAEVSGPLRLDDYILAALKSNFGLRSAYSKYQAAKERGTQAASLPDPTLTYGYFINSVETRVGPQEHKAGIMQSFPWFGKLNLKGEIADAEAKAEYFRFLSLKDRLVGDVAGAYFELVYLEKAHENTKAAFDLLQQWEQVALQRLRGGKGTHSTVIKVQVELGKLEDRLAELKDLRIPLQANFRALLGKESFEVIKIDSGDLSPPKVLPVSLRKDDLTLEEHTALLQKHNSTLQMLSVLEEAKGKGIELAKKDFFPDFSIGLDYIFVGDREMAADESGDDAMVAMVSMKFPLQQSKYRAGLRQSKRLQESVKESYHDMLSALKAKLARAYFKRQDSRRRSSLYLDTLIPKAIEALETAYSAFEGGEASFLDLLDTQRMLLDFNLALSRSLADFHISTAELEGLIGSAAKGGEDDN